MGKEQQQSREAIAFAVLKTMLDWLDTLSVAVAIFDATNSTVQRRRGLLDEVQKRNASYTVIFIETRCSDPAMLEANIDAKIARSPDYTGMEYEDAKRDFMSRVDCYRRGFEPLGSEGREEDLSYIKMLNLSWHLEVHKVYGRMTTSLLPYLMALHIGCRPVWLIPMSQLATQMGSEAANTPDQTAQESDECFNKNVRDFMQLKTQMCSSHIFACTHQCALDSAAHLASSDECIFVRPALNSMDWGVYEGVSRETFEERMSPEFFANFVRDPINTRFPGGECYDDVVRRLMPVVVEIEQTLDPVLVIAPISVLQVLHCYFAQISVHGASEVHIPMHAITEWRPNGAGFAHRCIDKSELTADIAAVSGHCSVESKSSFSHEQLT